MSSVAISGLTVHVVAGGTSSTWWHSSAVYALLGALIGSGVSVFLSWRARKGDRKDRLHDQRRLAYSAFLGEAHVCSHELGKLAVEDGPNPRPLPSGDDADRIWYAADARVGKELRSVEMLGTKASVENARAVQRGLYAFRKRLSEALRAGTPLSYSDVPTSDYRSAFEPYRIARDEFVAHARGELGTES
jgi:hypothetical protein